jgi:predicted O-methyltransferase YrrM
MIDKIDIEQLTSVWKGHREFSQWLINEVQPKVIVDLGVDYGYSTFCFAYPQIGHVYGIDHFDGDVHTGFHPDAEKVVRQVISENEINNITIIKERFEVAVQTWDKPIDILHIDGIHTYFNILDMYEEWKKFLHEKSVILMHDVSSYEGAYNAYAELEYEKLAFPHSAGLGVLTKDVSLINKIKSRYGETDE